MLHMFGILMNEQAFIVAFNTFMRCLLFISMYVSIAGSKGRGTRDVRPPPLDQNVFIFMQFLGEIGQIVCWRPPQRLAPPLGNPGSTTGTF